MFLALLPPCSCQNQNLFFYISIWNSATYGIVKKSSFRLFASGRRHVPLAPLMDLSHGGLFKQLFFEVKPEFCAVKKKPIFASHQSAKKMFFSISPSSIAEIKKEMPVSQLSGSECYQYINGKLVQRPPKSKRVSEANDNYECFDQQLFIFTEDDLDKYMTKKKKAKCLPENREFSLNKTKIRKKLAAYFMLEASRKFCAFYSISFPCQISDDLAYQVFNTWLTRCRRDSGLNSYVWIAERQENGTIHFHLLTHNYMKIRQVNSFMTAALATQIINGKLNYSIQAIEKYNGVDVDNLYFSKRAKNQKNKLSKVEAQRKLSRYVSKYVTKNNTKMNRLAWHCSRDVSALFTSQFFNEDEFFEYREAIYNERCFKKIIKDEFITLYIPLLKDNLAACTILEKVNNEVFAEFHRKILEKSCKIDLKPATLSC